MIVFSSRIVSVSIVELMSVSVAVALVDSIYTHSSSAGNKLLAELAPHFLTLPIMLVSIEKNGFRAHATFQTSVLLALLQMEQITFCEMTLDRGNIEERALPF